MKKIISLMLGLALVMGTTASFAFAQEEKKEEKKKKGKKKKEEDKRSTPSTPATH